METPNTFEYLRSHDKILVCFIAAHVDNLKIKNIRISNHFVQNVYPLVEKLLQRKRHL